MKVGVLTSGGDSPGMNACIRAIVRVGISRGLNIFGIQKGLQGLLDRKIEMMEARSVANIVHRGGTILTTGRSKEFYKEEGQKKAAKILEEEMFDGLLALGGNGTMQALVKLQQFWNGRIIGLPGTIDNDLSGTDFTIGFDTAVNNAIDAVDKIRDTAQAFDRMFLIEVMGRHAGHIALHVGIAGGADVIAIPETPTDLDAIAKKIISGKKRGKTFAFIVVAEGDEEGDANTIAGKLSDAVGDNCRVSVLGYIQRGGNPSHFDRILGTKLGAFAVESFLNGETGIMVGEIGGKLTATPLEETFSKQKDIDHWMYDLVDELSI